MRVSVGASWALSRVVTKRWVSPSPVGPSAAPPRPQKERLISTASSQPAFLLQVTELELA